MTQENLIKVVGIVAGLALMLLGIFLPTEVGTWQPVIAAGVALAGALIAIFVPAGQVVQGIYEARARSAYFGAVASGKIKPRGATGDIPDIVYTYSLSDVSLIYDYVVKVLKQSLGTDAPDKTIIAGRFFDFVQRYDIRPLKERTERVPLMLALADKAFELTKAAWEEFKIPLPTPEICAAPARHMFELKKAYQAANNQVCGDPVYSKMRAMLGDFNEIYQLQYGLGQMKDKTVDWSVLDWNSPVGIGLLVEAWPKMC